MSSSRLPRGLLSRATAAGRVALGVARAGAHGDPAVLGEQLFAELDRLKGLPMKVGQILSAMDVALPEPIRARLAGLQTGRSPLDLETLRPIVEAELGAPLHELFDSFEARPCAAASVGQVHRATVDGQSVAVKIRYPGVRELLEGDLRVFRPIARLAGLSTAVDGERLLDALRDHMVDECDYQLEARNQRRYATLVPAPYVVPEVVDRLSSDGVLTTTWAEGTPLADVENWSTDERRRLAHLLLGLPFHTLFPHGILHGDPHPGNVLARPDGLVVLDFGSLVEVPSVDLLPLHALFIALLDRDTPAFREKAVQTGLVPDPDRIDWPEMEAFLQWLTAPWFERDFTPDDSWWKAGQRFAHPTHPNQRRQGLPPLWMWLERTMWGTAASARRLRVTVDVVPTIRAILEEGCHEPSATTSAPSSSTASTAPRSRSSDSPA